MILVAWLAISDGSRHRMVSSGPLALAHDWQDFLVDGEIPGPTESPRLVMLENHRELHGTHADAAIRSLKSVLEDRGWEIVEDPGILAESIIDMPLQGIVDLDVEQTDVALASLEELSEKHLVDTVIFVRTEGDDHGGWMEIEFWTDGVGRITNLPLHPDVVSESMVTVDGDQARSDRMGIDNVVTRMVAIDMPPGPDLCSPSPSWVPNN